MIALVQKYVDAIRLLEGREPSKLEKVKIARMVAEQWAKKGSVQ